MSTVREEEIARISQEIAKDEALLKEAEHAKRHCWSQSARTIFEEEKKLLEEKIERQTNLIRILKGEVK